jgi:hypothetical protein
MSATPFNVRHMSKMIHRTLKEAAAREGMSLSDYIKRELVGVGARSSLERIEARARNREPARWAPGEVVKIIREHRGE